MGPNITAVSLPYSFLSGPSLSDAQPTEAETAVWNQVSAVLEEAHGILAELQSYNGAGQEIREVSTTTPLGRDKQPETHIINSRWGIQWKRISVAGKRVGNLRGNLEFGLSVVLVFTILAFLGARYRRKGMEIVSA